MLRTILAKSRYLVKDFRLCLVFSIAVLTVACSPQTEMTGVMPKQNPIIIAHRGASGYFPQHTLEGYKAAIEMGADYIEPDLVMTKDGVPVARHDSYLSTTTNVADKTEFLERKRYNKAFEKSDWWVEDFTLAEIKTLRARQDFPGRSTEKDDIFQIPTFTEVLALARSESKRVGRAIGVYPETKHPSYFRDIGLDPVPAVLLALTAADMNSKDSPVFIQSFDPSVFEPLRAGSPLPLVLLLAPNEEGKPNYDISDFEGLVSGIGPYKHLVLSSDGTQTELVKLAHSLGMVVHPWTFRNDQLPDGTDDPLLEYEAFFEAGVDGVFSDFSDTAVVAREAYLNDK